MQIQNPEAAQIIRDQAGLTIAEGFPQNLLPNVQPVMDMTPRFHKKPICLNGSTTTSGTGTVVSAKAGVRYMIHGFAASFIKDATCDGADGSIQWNLTQGGVTRTICSFPVLTLTAQNGSLAASFVDPIICDEETIIQAASYTFTAGKCRRNIVLYITELTK